MNRLRIFTRYLTETVLNWTSIILLCIISVACSQSGAPAVNIHADAAQTFAGGYPITLTASHPAAEDTVTWSIDEQNPGKLDSDSGHTVHYLPPAAGTITQPTSITVTATASGARQTVLLSLQPSAPMSIDANAGKTDSKLANKDASRADRGVRRSDGSAIALFGQLPQT